MNDRNSTRQPNKLKLDQTERWDREKAEDERRYRHYLETGKCISHEEMMAWFDQLEREAELKT